MKNLFFALFAVVLLAACNKNSDGDKSISIISGEKNYIVYADETTTSEDGIKFTAKQPWKASVTEEISKASDVDWIELSAYEGGAGDFTLTITLKPNLTGNSRKAIINIVCGDTIITIIVEQIGTKEDGSIPDIVNPLGKLITKIEYQGHYDKWHIDMNYDNKERMVKMIEESGNYSSIVNIIYGENSVAYKMTRIKNGIDTKSKDNGFIKLGNNGYAINGTAIWEEEFSAEYTLSYNTEGYLTEVNRIKTEGYDKGLNETCTYTWSNGNLIGVLYSDNQDNSSTSKATYGDVLNNANIDLNWSVALNDLPLGTGDPWDIFALLGYTGKRSKYMAEQVLDSNDTELRFEYTVDKDGYVTFIACYNYESSTWEKSMECKITYNK